MKKIYVSMAIVLFLFIGFSNNALSQSITVSGAGSSIVNGNYPLSVFTPGGKVSYTRGGDGYTIMWDSDRWILINGPGSLHYYYNTNNTTLPPNVGWQIGGDGTAPAPVAGGDITSLLVGDGTSGAPYQISSLNSLYWIALNSTEWGKYFVQTTNINASETSTWFSGAGWTPIASLSEKFTGSYNGGGFSISGLTINRPASNAQGLFFSLFNAAVSDLSLLTVNITGNVTVGVLSAYIEQSTITNVSSSGTVSGARFVGGLAGSVNSTSILTSCSSAVTVNGSTDLIGGLVGRVDGSTIQNSLFTGAVIGGAESQYLGGITGFQYQGSITRCVSRGSVSGYVYVGGIAGISSGGTVSDSYNRGSVGTGYGVAGLVSSLANGSSIDHCYSTGSITGVLNFSGLIYSNDASTVAHSFWDTEASGMAASGGGGTGKTTAEMKNGSTFISAGWDNTTWFMESGINNGYPYLAWEHPGGSPMPVELTSLTATIKQNSVELQWKTATEVNNYGYEIEKCKTGEGRSEMWKKIGFVEGNGTTNSPKSYNFVDASAQGKVSYRLKQIDRDGKFEYSSVVEATVVEIQSFGLEQNYPNPFNPVTMIKYQLPINSPVTLNVYDVIGREVATLVNEVKEAGSYTAKIDGSKLSSGIYFYTLHAGNFSATKKLSLMK